MKAKTAVWLLTFYLLAYTILFQLQVSTLLYGIMFLLSPILMVLTVFIVLNDDSKPYPDLKEGEEWGYLDKAKSELNIF